MTCRRWFHPSISGLEAERLLMVVGYDGCFLARHSHSNPGDFTLSVRRGDEVTHIKIQNNGEFLDLYGGEKFATLSELVQFYMDNHDQLREKGGTVIELRCPVNCADPTTERWYHGHLTAKDAERLMLENGKNGSFLVRESQRRPGEFVLSVRSGHRVTHVNIIRRSDNSYDIGGGEKFDDLVGLIEYYRNYPMVETSGDVLRLLQPFNATRIHARDIDTRVKQLQKENEGPIESMAYKQGFWEEFEDLQMMENLQLFDRLEGSKPENIYKNRYKNIVPFDHTRVILRDTSSNARPGADYINANYIRMSEPDPQTCDTTGSNGDSEEANGACPDSMTGKDDAEKASSATSSASSSLRDEKEVRAASGSPHYVNTTVPNKLAERDGLQPHDCVYKKTYIATQGCLPSTIPAFWSMIWQDDVRIIVMTTKEIERGKVKCERYWPEVGNATTFGMCRILNESESSTPDYTLRQFTVSKVDTSDSRQIFQYHFTAWPDHGVPSEPGRVLNILLDVNYRLEKIMDDPKGPSQATICVHCSAGIGRTGTFIVIDMILDQIRRHGFDSEIDIHRTVQMVRDQRSGMVQNEAQYKFIYLAVQELVETVKQRLGMQERTSKPYVSATPPPSTPPHNSGISTPLPLIPPPRPSKLVLNDTRLAAPMQTYENMGAPAAETATSAPPAHTPVAKLKRTLLRPRIKSSSKNGNV